MKSRSFAYVVFNFWFWFWFVAWAIAVIGRLVDTSLSTGIDWKLLFEFSMLSAAFNGTVSLKLKESGL